MDARECYHSEPPRWGPEEQMRTTVPALWTALLLAGCGSPPPEPAPPSPPAPIAAPVPTPEEVDKILAPSPLKLEAAVREAGVADALGDLVPSSPAEVTTDDKDRIAVRTGVVLAYAVLGGHTTPKADFVAQLRSARAGMAALGAGAGLMSTIDDSITHVENDAASRDDFLRELDDVVGYSVPQEGWGPGDRTGPLLQAGAWLAGTNVMARAIVRSGKAEAADKLLRRKDVADYFLRYVKTQGQEKAGPVATQLEQTLTALATLSDKPKLGIEDAQAVADATGALLKLL